MNSGHSNLRIQVVRDEIIVTSPGTIYAVTYYKIPESPGLLAKRMPERDDPRINMTAAEFLASAWKLAKGKAAQIGWA
jgi:hypothetical protein